MDPHLCNGASLAYLGDAVIELLTRRTLLESGIQNVGHLNRAAANFVRATAQSDAAERILPLLTEEETAFFKRGRNTGGLSVPKSASTVQYRRATGLEALFAYLFLTDQQERMQCLFSQAYPISLETLSKNT